MTFASSNETHPPGLAAGTLGGGRVAKDAAPSFYSRIAAKIWGRFAAKHNTDPGVFDMGIISKITPVAQDEHATIHWLNSCIERGKREVFTSRVLMTPGVAAELLRRNPNNRNISAAKAEHYARDMAAGHWAENGETIIISRDGLLNDGQHRLQAAIDSNAIVPFICVFGVGRETRITVDQGKARGAQDYLSMDNVPYAHNASVAAKFIMAYEQAGGRNISNRSKFTNAEVVRRVKSDDEIIAAAAYAHKHYKQYRSLVSHSVFTACYYLLSEINQAQATEYMEQVALGENIKRGDAAFAVREAFLRQKYERQDAMEIILHGWNAYRQNRTLKLVTAKGTLPALV